jgi:uncharacterized membrane protein YeiH
VLTNYWYLPIAVVASLVGMVLVRLIARLEPLWVVLDAPTVGLYAAIGMTKALGIGLPLLPAMFVGVTAAVGGSALRDMLLAIPVAMLKVGTLYAVAAVAGTIALAASLACGAYVHVAAVVCAPVTTAVRMCAARRTVTRPVSSVSSLPIANMTDPFRCDVFVGSGASSALLDFRANSDTTQRRD